MILAVQIYFHYIECSLGHGIGGLQSVAKVFDENNHLFLVLIVEHCGATGLRAASSSETSRKRSMTRAKLWSVYNLQLRPMQQHEQKQ